MRALPMLAAGAALLVWPQAARAGLAAAAGALLEALPFVLLSCAFARWGRLPAALLGCGCGRGPAARSLPVAVATALQFGPGVAVARLLAGWIAGFVIARLGGHSSRLAHADCNHPGRELALGELTALLPAVAVAAAVSASAASVVPVRPPLPIAIAIGAALGFAASPCGLGAVAIAASLRSHGPALCAAYLSVAGILDLRALTARPRAVARPDAFGFGMLAIAAAAAASSHGAGLVRPAFVPALWACAAAATYGLFVHRKRRDPRARWAPAIALAGGLIAAPPPAYFATETTLAGAFAGERVDFTGTLVRDRSSTALVRYAITCCRADAAPIVIRLSRPAPFRSGAWLRAEGTIETADGTASLVVRRLHAVAPPADPFVYR